MKFFGGDKVRWGCESTVPTNRRCDQAGQGNRIQALYSALQDFGEYELVSVNGLCE